MCKSLPADPLYDTTTKTLLSKKKSTMKLTPMRKMGRTLILKSDDSDSEEPPEKRMKENPSNRSFYK